jgi:hypothetical protein
LTQIKAVSNRFAQAGIMLKLRHAKALSHAVIAFVALVLFAPAVADSSGVEEWRTVVAEDIRFKHSCRVTFFSHVVERELKGEKFVMVKVHCDDSRSFDAIRQGSDVPFIFSECTPREKIIC